MDDASGWRKAAPSRCCNHQSRCCNHQSLWTGRAEESGRVNWRVWSYLVAACQDGRGGWWKR
eukprot:360731-Chlamydomonas_euryale.AAC.1